MTVDLTTFYRGDTNLYAYAFGDPVNRVDRTGRAPGDAFWVEPR